MKKRHQATCKDPWHSKEGNKRDAASSLESPRPAKRHKDAQQEPQQKKAKTARSQREQGASAEENKEPEQDQKAKKDEK